MNTQREPSGVPTGGRFATSARGEADLSLAELAEADGYGEDTFDPDGAWMDEYDQDTEHRVMVTFDESVLEDIRENPELIVRLAKARASVSDREVQEAWRAADRLYDQFSLDKSVDEDYVSASGDIAYRITKVGAHFLGNRYYSDDELNGAKPPSRSANTNHSGADAIRLAHKALVMRRFIGTPQGQAVGWTQEGYDVMTKPYRDVTGKKVHPGD